MDLNHKAIQNLERLKHLQQQNQTLQIDTGPMYDLLKQEMLLRNTENAKIKNNITREIKHINRIHPIKIPVDKDFARIAQGAKVSGSILPSGRKIYDRIDNYEWVIRGNFAVLENQIG